jgi:hypothetical protein
MLIVHFLLISFCFSFKGAVYDQPLRFDSFGGIDCKQEVVRLDNYLSAVEATPKSTAVVIVYGGRRDTRQGEVLARLVGIRDYLTQKGLDTERILILNGGYREKLTIELWLLPSPEHATTLLNPTLRHDEVVFRKGTIKKWEYKCRPEGGLRAK